MTYYVKFYGQSCDGSGQSSIVGVTTDLKDVVLHLKKIKKGRGYAFGHVIACSETEQIAYYGKPEDIKCG